MIPTSLLGTINMPPVSTVAPSNLKPTVAGYEKLSPDQKKNLEGLAKDLAGSFKDVKLFSSFTGKIGEGGGGLGVTLGKFKGIAGSVGSIKGAVDSYKELKEVDDARDQLKKDAQTFNATLAEAHQEVDDSVVRIEAVTEVAVENLKNEQKTVVERVQDFETRKTLIQKLMPYLIVGGAITVLGGVFLIYKLTKPKKVMVV